MWRATVAAAASGDLSGYLYHPRKHKIAKNACQKSVGLVLQAHNACGFVSCFFQEQTCCSIRHVFAVFAGWKRKTCCGCRNIHPNLLHIPATVTTTSRCPICTSTCHNQHDMKTHKIHFNNGSSSCNILNCPIKTKTYHIV